MSTTVPKPPEILNKIVDLVLTHKPKPNLKGTKKRKKAKHTKSSAPPNPT